MYKKKLIHIGTFGRPIGLKGDIKILVEISDLEFLKKIKIFSSKDGVCTWQFKLLKIVNTKVIAKLKNYDTRTDVERLTGKKFFIERNKFPKIKNNEYYAFDLIKCEVRLKDKSVIGIISKVDNFGAGDLINVKPFKGKEFYVPMNKENIISINISKNYVVINPIKGIF